MLNLDDRVDGPQAAGTGSVIGDWIKEVRDGQRFGFGRNWQKFLDEVHDGHIAGAETSLVEMLGARDLDGETFLDIGSGSGLSSLAALRLGAKEVLSFDFDLDSVASAERLRRRYAGDARWIVKEGSVLDHGFLSKLGDFDVVYSWGVLHHTGNMWLAMENVCPLVKPGGKLFIALYNDEGRVSSIWRSVKILYNSGWIPRWALFGTFFAWQIARGLFVDLVIKRQGPLARYRNYKAMRGMSFTRDLDDWLGGYPYEVAKPEQVFEFYTRRGFTLTKFKTVGRGHGNNEFVFTKRGINPE